MKNFFFTLIIILSISLAYGQIPETISYQLVVRDGSDELLANANVGLKISILSGSSTGTEVYSEEHLSTTNSNGLATLEIGNGTSVTGDLSTIDWGANSYFIKTEVDPTGGTTYVLETVDEITSTPFATYSKTAQVAETADYNTLTNLPTTISQAQIDKLALLTVTIFVDLDQLSMDVVANNAKISFPGFGTTAGLALEGNNAIWSKSNNDAFYDAGNVAIGIDPNLDFGGARLHVGGGIKFTSPANPLTQNGTLYYNDSNGDGKFEFINSEGNVHVLGGSTWSTVGGDTTTSTDVIINGSIGIGLDTFNGEDFGFETMILKENNLRILFDDSDDPNGTMPANDWQIEINNSSNGGDSFFGINDITNNKTPFKLSAITNPSDPNDDNFFFIADNGNVGIGTITPSEALEVNGVVKATSFVGDGSGLTGLATGTGGLSNPEDTIIISDSDANGVGEISLQTQNMDRLTITNSGNVGIGISTPTAKLDVNGNVKFNSAELSGTTSVNILRFGNTTNTDDVSATLEVDASDKSTVIFNNSIEQTIQGFSNGLIGQQVTIINLGTGVKTISHNSGTQPVLLPSNISISLAANQSATFYFDGTSWYCIAKNN